MIMTPGRSVRVDVVRRTKMKPSVAKPNNKTAINFAGEPLLFRGPAGTTKAGRIGISRQSNPSSHGVRSCESAGLIDLAGKSSRTPLVSPPVVTCCPIVISPPACSTTGFQYRARVTRGLVAVLERPSVCRQVIRTRHHHEVTVETVLQDEPGPGNLRSKRHHNDRPPPELRSQTLQFPTFTFRGRRVRRKALQVEPGVPGRAIV